MQSWFLLYSFYMLIVYFHIILQLYFGGEVSSGDFPPAPDKAQYKGQLFNIIEIIFKCDFSIIKQKKKLLLALYSIFSIESQDAFYCRAKKGIDSPICNCDSNIRILFYILANVQLKKKKFVAVKYL